MGTNLSALSATARKNILSRIEEIDSNKNATANKAGIPATSFDRNLKNPLKFSLEDLGNIAEALDMGLGDIIKGAP